MTRWARSKGSAASNERVEEEATPWSQLVAGVRPEKHHDVEDLEDFHEEEEAEQIDVKTDKVVPEQEEEEEEQEESEAEEGKPKVLIEAEEKEEGGKKKKRKRNQDKCLNCKQKGHLKKECPDLSDERRKELQELYTMKIERKGHGTGRKKNKNKNKQPSADTADPSKQQDPSKPVEDKEAAPPAKHPFDKKKFEKKNSDNKKFDNKRGGPPKKPLVDITGQQVGDDEGLFQGFRVRKEAVKKLKSMQAQLKAEERSEEEIAETMKRERRKAERELAKFIKMVCFNCRKSGHLLIDCPENKDSNNVKVKDSNCYKCGSKEHTSRDCKSKRKGADAYAFATCFICKETGHLAKSCPDNPRGLYPKGGGCRFCGSVEHLKADCNRKAAKDEKQEVRLDFGKVGAGLEDIVDDHPQAKKAKIQPKKKAVNF